MGESESDRLVRYSIGVVGTDPFVAVGQRRMDYGRLRLFDPAAVSRIRFPFRII